MKYLIFVLFFFLLLLPVHAVIINEIMYNPKGSDAGHEWIEIYNNNSFNVNIENWRFTEAGIDHTLKMVQGSFIIPSFGYAVIADESDTFLDDYPSYTGILIDSSWSSLSNSGELLALKNSNREIIDEVFYTTNRANGNGKSLELFEYGWNESNARGGSPGKQNNGSISIIEDNKTAEENETENKEESKKGLSLKINLDEILYKGVEYTSLFQITNLDHVTGIEDSINLTIQYNITRNSTEVIQGTVYVESLNSRKTANTGYFRPNKTGIYILTGEIIYATVNDTNKEDDKAQKQIEVKDTSVIECDIKVNISFDNFTYIEGNSIKFRNNLNNDSYPYQIEYWVEDFFGAIYKNKLNTSNTNKKSWKTKIDEQDRILFVKSKVYPLCNDTNRSNNEAEKMFIVLSAGEETAEANYEGDSRIEVTEVKDATFGEVLEVNLEVYKGDTRKTVLDAFVKKNNRKISDVTKLKIADKYTSFDGRVPIQLPLNCDEKYSDGTYTVIVEGLGEQDEKKVKIEGKSKQCHEKIEQSTSGKILFELVKSPDVISPNQPFDTLVEIENNDDESHDFKIWSYVYRGSKSYSGDREQNEKTFSLKPGEKEIIVLENKVAEADPGDYKFKVLLNKDNQKTNSQLIKEIKMQNAEQIRNVFNSEQLSNQNSHASSVATGNSVTREAVPEIIYESSSEKAKKFIPHLLILALMLLSFVLILKR